MCSFKADVTDEKTCNRIFEKIAVDYGRLDILVNCAGVNDLESLFEMKVSTWDHILNINLKGVMFRRMDASIEPLHSAYSWQDLKWIGSCRLILLHNLY